LNTKKFGLGFATLLAIGCLPGCSLDGAGSILLAIPTGGDTVSSRGNNVSSRGSTTTVVHNHTYDNGGYRDDSYGGDSGWYTDSSRGTYSDSTTVITQSAPVVVQQVPVYVPTAPAANASIDPVIQAFMANPSNLVAQGQPITFTVVANDPNHDPLQFNWSSTGGTLSTNTGRVVTWIPPADAGTYTVSAIITNGRGGVVTGSQNLMVLADGRVNTAATAHALPPQTTLPVATAPVTPPVTQAPTVPAAAPVAVAPPAAPTTVAVAPAAPAATTSTTSTTAATRTPAETAGTTTTTAATH
jgi:hypothetical protein